MIKNIEWIKIANVKRAIDYARRVERFSKREMADALDICFTTASNIVNTLEGVAVLDEVVLPKNRAPGRVTKWYRLRDERLSFLVVNFSNTALTTVALVNLRHEVEAKVRFVIEKGEDWLTLSRKLKDAYLSLLRKTGLKDENIVAVGVSVQGSYNSTKDILYSSEQPALHKRNLHADFSRLFSKSIIIQNDIDMAAAYTARLHSSSYFVYVYLDYQVGIGVINRGEVLCGFDGLTTEVAHAPIGDSGKRCPSCGAYNCLELSLGKGAFLEEYYGREFPICAGGYEKEWKAFMEALCGGDTRAMEIMAQKTDLLTRMIIIVLSITRASTVMIGGIDKDMFTLICPLLKGKMQEWEKRYTVSEILHDSCAEKTILIGTMDAVYQKWYPGFENDQLWVDRGGRDVVMDSMPIRP